MHAVQVADPRTILVAVPGPAEAIATDLAKRLPEERRALDRLIGLADESPLEIRIGYGRDEFRSLQPSFALAPGWAAGVAYPGLGLVVLDAQASGRSGDAGGVLRHELAHVALGRLLSARIPHWFTEGFAMLYADEWTLSRSATLARASAAGALIPLDDIDRSWPSSPSDVDLAYAQSASFVAHLARIDEGAPFHRLVAAMADGVAFDDAILSAYGQPFLIHELTWKKSLRARFGWLPVFLDHELMWGWAALLLVAGAWRIHRRKRRRLAAMPDEPDPDADGEEALEPSAGQHVEPSAGQHVETSPGQHVETSPGQRPEPSAGQHLRSAWPYRMEMTATAIPPTATETVSAVPESVQPAPTKIR